MTRFVLLLSLLVIGCAQTTPQVKKEQSECPKWTLLGNRDPAGKYIFGVGSGITQQEAADNARADIARFFNVQIARESVSGEQYTQSGQKYHYSFRATNAVVSRVNRVLSGVQILKKAFCKDRYWTLAGLEISPLRYKLRSRLNSNLKDIDRLLASADRAGDPAKAMGLCLKALKLIDDSEAIVSDLVVLGMHVDSMQEKKLRALQMFERFREKVAFFVDRDEPARSILQEELTSRGFKIESSPDNARFIITVKYVRYPIKRLPKTYHWARATFSFKVMDALQNNVVYDFSPHTFDSAAMSTADAMKRADFLLRKRLIHKAIKKMFKVLWGDVK